jgi:hypothetical protein
MEDRAAALEVMKKQEAYYFPTRTLQANRNWNQWRRLMCEWFYKVVDKPLKPPRLQYHYWTDFQQIAVIVSVFTLIVPFILVWLHISILQ